MHEAQLFLHLLAELHTSPGDSPNSAASNTPADLLLESCHGGRAVAQVLEAAPKSPKTETPSKAPASCAYKTATGGAASDPRRRCKRQAFGQAEAEAFAWDRL